MFFSSYSHFADDKTEVYNKCTSLVKSRVEAKTQIWLPISML